MQIPLLAAHNKQATAIVGRLHPSIRILMRSGKNMDGIKWQQQQQQMEAIK
jgi:hypothetical protein